MSGQLALSYTLRYIDQGSAQAGAALRVIDRSLQGVKDASSAASRAQKDVDQGLARVASTAATGSRAVYDYSVKLQGAGAAAAQAAAGLERAGGARVADGVRQVGRQVDDTTAAIRRMNQEATAGSRALGLLRGVGQVGAGVAAARAVMAPQVSQTMSYDRRLANLANTAFPESEGESARPTTVAERQAGMRELDAAVIAAVRTGGGTRDTALATLDKLIASGVYKAADAGKALPTLQKFGAAADADPGTLADIAIRARQSMGITDLKRVLDQSMRAGQLGGFELKDMARWLPQQMAMGRMSGLNGEAGLRVLLAANQAAVTTAGSKDEAGNNLVNLLAKINAQDTANDAGKLGINLPGSLAAARQKGVNSLDAFVNLVEQIVAKDKQFTDLRKKAARATGDEQRATYGSMADILQGGAVGKMVQDRQALLALVGIMGNRTGMESMREQLLQADGTGERAFDLIKETPSFKAELAAAEKAIAMQKAMDNVNPLLGDLADKVVALAREFPNLTAGAVAATTALTALAAGAGVMSLAGKVLGWGSAGAAAAGAAGAAGAGAAGLGAGAAALLGAGSLAAGGSLGYGLYSAGRGTKLGDGLGNFILEVGAFFGSQKAQEDLAVIRQLEAAAVAQQATAQRLADLAAGVAQRPPIVVQLDGRQIYTSVDEIATEQARRR